MIQQLLAGLVMSLALVLGVGGPAHAQDPPVETQVEENVVVFNRTVTVFRGPFLGVSAERRARRTEQIILELLDKASAGEVTVQVQAPVHVILMDGELALVLTAKDVDTVRNQTLAQASSAARTALQNVWAETRASRDSQHLISSVINSLLATLLAIALTWLARRTRRWAVARLADLVAQRASQVRVAGAELWQTERLTHLVSLALRAISTTLVILVAYHWVGFVLRQFPYTRPWGEQLTTYLVGVVSQLGRGTLHALPDLVIAVAIFLIARSVIAMFRPFFARIKKAGPSRTGWLDADTAGPTQQLLSVMVWLFAVVMAYPYLPGAQSEAFKGVTLLIGLTMTIGGSSIFGQAASGLVLMYSRTFRVGEFVRIDDQEGTITEMGAFTTRIRTGLGEELTIPNAMALATITKNYSRAVVGVGYVVDTTVTASYETPWRLVEELLFEAARRTSGVLNEPLPRVFQTALSDAYASYRLVCQAIPSQPRPRAEVLSALHANIQDVFNERGVQLMSPSYLVNLTAEDRATSNNKN